MKTVKWWDLSGTGILVLEIVSPKVGNVVDGEFKNTYWVVTNCEHTFNDLITINLVRALDFNNIVDSFPQMKAVQQLDRLSSVLHWLMYVELWLRKLVAANS